MVEESWKQGGLDHGAGTRTEICRSLVSYAFLRLRFGIFTYKTPRQQRRITPIFVLVGSLSVRNIMMGMDMSPMSAMIETAAKRQLHINKLDVILRGA